MSVPMARSSFLAALVLWPMLAMAGQPSMVSAIYGYLRDNEPDLSVHLDALPPLFITFAPENDFHAEVPALLNGSDPGNVAAIYLPHELDWGRGPIRAGVILIKLTSAHEDRARMSTHLLHETVHHVQHFGIGRSDCLAADELKAYQVQNRFVEKFYPHRQDLKAGPMFLMMLHVACKDGSYKQID